MRAATSWLDSPWSNAAWVCAWLLVAAFYWLIRAPRRQDPAGPQVIVHVHHHLLHPAIPAQQGWDGAEVTQVTGTGMHPVAAKSRKAIAPAPLARRPRPAPRPARRQGPQAEGRQVMGRVGAPAGRRPARPLRRRRRTCSECTVRNTPVTDSPQLRVSAGPLFSLVAPLDLSGALGRDTDEHAHSTRGRDLRRHGNHRLWYRQLILTASVLSRRSCNHLIGCRAADPPSDPNPERHLRQLHHPRVHRRGRDTACRCHNRDRVRDNRHVLLPVHRETRRPGNLER